MRILTLSNFVAKKKGKRVRERERKKGRNKKEKEKRKKERVENFSISLKVGFPSFFSGCLPVVLLSRSE